MTRCPVCKSSIVTVFKKGGRVAVTIQGGSLVTGSDGDLYSTSEESTTEVQEYGEDIETRCNDCEYTSPYREEFWDPSERIAICAYVSTGILADPETLLGIHEVTQSQSIGHVKEEVEINLPEGVEMSQVRYFGLDIVFGIRALEQNLDVSTDLAYRQKLLKVCRVYQNGGTQLFA